MSWSLAALFFILLVVFNCLVFLVFFPTLPLGGGLASGGRPEMTQVFGNGLAGAGLMFGAALSVNFLFRRTRRTA